MLLSLKKIEMVRGLDQEVKDAVCFKAQDFFEYYQSSISRKPF